MPCGSAPLFLQLNLNNKIYRFQCKKDGFENAASLRFTGHDCTRLAVSALSCVINSSSVLGDCLLGGISVAVGSSSPSVIEGPTF